jgi:hypothetical protein
MVGFNKLTQNRGDGVVKGWGHNQIHAFQTSLKHTTHYFSNLKRYIARKQLPAFNFHVKTKTRNILTLSLPKSQLCDS